MHDDTERWTHLMRLLEPIHDRARMTARRLGRSRAEGDDLFHDAIVRAHRKLHTLRDEGRFRSWFYAVLLSVHRNRTRRSFWRRFLHLDDIVATGREPAGDDGWVRENRRFRAERATRALERLPVEQRQAVVLHDIDGFSMEEIAAMQGVTVSAVKSRVARGRERLRQCYERWGRQTSAEPNHRVESLAVSGTDPVP